MDETLTASAGECPGELPDPCADVDCDELPCPEDVQYTFDGGCCPACPQDWGLDPCHLSGTCDLDLVTVTDPCADVDCDELPCPEDVQYTFDGGCCPACPQDWGLDPCHLSGTCDLDLVTVTVSDPCADVDCDELPCPEDVQYTFDGGCCPACPLDWGLDPCHLSGTCDPDLVTVIDPCADVDCDELPCPEDVQYTFDDGCCPACPQDWGLDPCHLSGTCDLDLVTVTGTPDPCADVECPVLTCPEDLQHTYDGECCPECPQDWGLDPCHFTGTCDLPTGTPDPCADVECPVLTCPEDLQGTYEGQCCPECPQDWGYDPCHFTDTCGLPTEIPDPCADVECEELPCPEHLQRTYDEKCCPQCPEDWGVDPCIIGGGPCPLPTDDCKGHDCKIPHCGEGYTVGYQEGVCCPSCVEVDPCSNVTCDVVVCDPGFVLEYEAENCCPGCKVDPDPCTGIYCDIPACPPGHEVDYDGDGCCPVCVEDPDCEGVHCDIPVCPEGYEVDYGGGSCCPVGCTEESDPCAGFYCDIPVCPPGMEVTYDEGCCPVCLEVPDPCADTKCYELDCPEDLQHTYDGECCPQCPEDWGLDPCHWTGTCFQPSVTTEAIPPRDCSEVDNTISGVYQVSPDGGEPVSVYCDFVTKHGPWTVIQRRSDGSVDFHQKMAEYQAGFGNLEGEFWLGLDNIYKFVSSDVYQLRIDLTNYRHVSKHATYSEFAISDESDGYRLHLGKYTGNARDSLSYHKGMQFTTRDVDRDEHDNKNCARFHKGAWWFKRCFRSNLNGRHRDPLQKRPDGIIWAFWRGYTETIPFVEMKIRRPL